MNLIVETTVEAEGWGGLPGAEAVVGRSLAAAAAGTELDGEEAEVSVLLCDDDAIRTLNREWRGKDKATNVLSFPAPPVGLPGAPRLLGDIAIAFETLDREAAEEGKAPEAHLAHLLVHGFLHLVGHDHEDEAQAEAMEALETRIVQGLGYPDPYAGTDPVRAAAR